MAMSNVIIIIGSNAHFAMSCMMSMDRISNNADIARGCIVMIVLRILFIATNSSNFNEQKRQIRCLTFCIQSCLSIIILDMIL